MRRSWVCLVAVLTVGCKKEAPSPLASTSARAPDPGPPKPKFGDQTRPPVDLRPQIAPPRERTPEEWRSAFEAVCNDTGRCDKYLVSAEIGAAPPAMAKELTQMCWEARKIATTKIKTFAAELAKIEATSRRAPYHGTPSCDEGARGERAALVALESSFGGFDRTTPERGDMRAALDAVGRCHECSPDHLAKCDEAKRLVTALTKTATAKQDVYCKEQLQAGGRK
jgi:hypothetical protein